MNATTTRREGNQINWWFGEFMLAVLRQDDATQSLALKHLQRLAHGIAHNKGLFPPIGPNWNDAVNKAVLEQWNRFRHLTAEEIEEHRGRNKFAVVSNAMWQRMIDEIRSHCARRTTPGSDAFFNNLHSDYVDLQDALVDLPFEGLLDDVSGLSPGNQGIFAAVVQTARDPDVTRYTDSQVREITIKGAAEIRQVSLQQARRDLKRVTAAPEKRVATLRACIPRRRPIASGWRRNRPLGGADEGDP
jgi:hypothetical protein